MDLKTLEAHYKRAILEASTVAPTRSYVFVERGSAFNFRPLSVLSDYANNRIFTCWTNEDLTAYVSIFDAGKFCFGFQRVVIGFSEF